MCRLQASPGALANGTANGTSIAERSEGSPDPGARTNRQRNQGFIDDARDWYDYLLNSRLVKFCPHPKQQQPHNYEMIDLHLSTRLVYDQVAARLGEKIGVDPSHLRFFTVNASNQNPKSPVKRHPTQTLLQILTPQYGTFTNAQRSDALFYEVLEISLSELDTKKSVKITWLSEGITKEVGSLLCIAHDAANNLPGTFRCLGAQEWHYPRPHRRSHQKGTP